MYDRPVATGDRRLLIGLSLLSLVCLLGEASGVLSPDLLYLAPLLIVGLPLLAGRYVGEEAIERLAGAHGVGPQRPRVAAVDRPIPGRVVYAVPRGGRLIATSLAVRPPPTAASFTS